MTPTGNYLALFIGDKQGGKQAAWNALSETEQGMRAQQGIVAWQAWVTRHEQDIVAIGGPVGKTKRVDATGIEDMSNMIGAYMVVRASSHEEAAIIFIDHPHFILFPGDSVEIMPVHSIPDA